MKSHTSRRSKIYINECLLKGADGKLKIKMKNFFFLVGIIAVMGLGAFLISCEREVEEKSCSCKEFAPNGQLGGTKDLYPSSWGAKNCSELESKLRVQALSLGVNNNFQCN